MALNPIRWDNIASPQFNNSGYAVAGEAFGSATDSAAVLAKSMQEREEKRIAEQKAAATNAAIIQGMRDGKITAEDYQNLPEGADVGILLDKFGTQETVQSGVARDIAQTGAYNANTALTTAETDAYPDRILREIADSESRNAANTAAQHASVARQNLSEFELNERTRIGEERVALQTKTRAYEQAVTSGFRQEADDTFNKFVTKDGPPNPLLDTPEQREQFTAAKYNAKADSADEHRKIALENDLTLTEWATNPEAKRVLAIEQEGIARASERAAIAYDNDVAFQTGVDSYVEGIKGSAKYAGNEITFGKAGKKISKVQRTDLLNRYGLEESNDERVFTKLLANFPDSSMYEYELERLVVPAGRNLVGFKKKGYKLVDKAETLLQTHIDGLDSFAADIKNKRTTAYAGTSPEAAALNKAAADGSGQSGDPSLIPSIPDVIDFTDAKQATAAIKAKQAQDKVDLANSVTNMSKRLQDLKVGPALPQADKSRVQYFQAILDSYKHNPKSLENSAIFQGLSNEVDELFERSIRSRQEKAGQ